MTTEESYLTFTTRIGDYVDVISGWYEGRSGRVTEMYDITPLKGETEAYAVIEYRTYDVLHGTHMDGIAVPIRRLAPTRMQAHS